MKRDTLLAIIAEWLEEWEMPPLVSRHQPAIEPAGTWGTGIDILIDMI